MNAFIIFASEKQMKITNEVFQVTGPGLTTSEDAAGYLIKAGKAAAKLTNFINSH
jgi:hypothetical protein